MSAQSHQHFGMAQEVFDPRFQDYCRDLVQAAIREGERQGQGGGGR